MIIKHIRVITIFTFIFSIIMLLFCFFDFAALHDIGNDYISQKILTYLDITTSKSLPEWTKTKGEWLIVSISLIIRIVFLLLNTFLLYIYYKKVIPKIKRT